MEKAKALFIRMDRLGDLILTLPCDQRVSDRYDVQWMTSPGLDFVMEHSLPARRWMTRPKDFSWSLFFQFYFWLRREKPKVSVVFHAPGWVLAALWLARVPVRGGVLSKWPSYLFLNKGLRQKRSRCELHEMDYNYQLTEYVFDLPEDKNQWTPVVLEPKGENSQSIPSPYVIVHPGMGGSALNWPTSHYLELIKMLSETTDMVITGTATDQAYLKPLKLQLGSHPRVLWLDGKLSGPQLLHTIKNASAIVAPSTGVIHVGASLGAASFGIYSPIQVHHPNRWGPKGPRAFSFLPEVTCPSQFECLGESCKHYPCMDRLRPQVIFQAVQNQISG